MMKQLNLDRLLFIYINERILNRPNRLNNKKLLYTHDILASDEELTKLKDLLLQNESDNKSINMKSKKQNQNIKDVKK